MHVLQIGRKRKGEKKRDSLGNTMTSAQESHGALQGLKRGVYHQANPGQRTNPKTPEEDKLTKGGRKRKDTLGSPPSAGRKRWEGWGR